MSFIWLVHQSYHAAIRQFCIIMDYRTLGVIHERVRQDVVELRQRLVETWTECRRASWMRASWMRPSNSGVTDSVVSCVPAEGRHFEHLL